MKKYRRSIFLINKKFQLRFSLYVCSWLFALSLVYPLIISNLFDYFIRYAALDPNGPALTTLEQTRAELMWLLVFLQIVFLAVTFLISIFMSHRIAGPLYKLKKFFEEVRGGKLRQDLYFRENDHFQDLAKEFNGMVGGIRDILEKNVQTADAAITRIERAMQHADHQGKKDLEEALAALREIRERTPS